jgi:hypothetical protein
LRSVYAGWILGAEFLFAGVEAVLSPWRSALPGVGKSKATATALLIRVGQVNQRGCVDVPLRRCRLCGAKNGKRSGRCLSVA